MVNLPKLPFKVPSVPFDRLGPRTRKVLKWVGLVFLALFVFVFALQATFPYDRVKDKIIEGLSEKYDVTIGSVDRGFMPGKVTFKAVTLRTRQTKPDDTITTFYVEKLGVNVGILSMLGGTIDVGLDAKIGRGELSGNVRVGKFGKGDISASFEGNSLPADALPMVSLIGLPMSGKLQFDVNINLPMEKSKMGKVAINWQKVRGGLNLACPTGCTFGDGKTRLKPLLKNTRNQVMVGEGIDFGKVSMDTMSAKVTIKNGKLTLDKFDTQSKDGVLKIDYMMTLEKDFSESMVAGCLRFKGSDDLLRREPKTHAALSTTGAELRSDGLFHIRLSDRFKDMKRQNLECGPGTNTNNGEDFNRGNRPNLTVQPDERPPTIPPPTTAQPPPAPAVPPPTPTPETPPATPATPPPHDATGSGQNHGGTGMGERGETRGSGAPQQPGSAAPGGSPGEQVAQPPTAPATPPPE